MIHAPPFLLLTLYVCSRIGTSYGSSFQPVVTIVEELPATPDLEVLDVNKDGRSDVYVVQTDESMEEKTYCAWSVWKYGPMNRWWGDKKATPPTDWIPPLDWARDLLLIGNGNFFDYVFMQHAIPGCGGLVQKFGDNHTLLLAQGTFLHPGFNLLLRW